MRFGSKNGGGARGGVLPLSLSLRRRGSCTAPPSLGLSRRGRRELDAKRGFKCRGGEDGDGSCGDGCCAGGCCIGCCGGASSGGSEGSQYANPQPTGRSSAGRISIEASTLVNRSIGAEAVGIGCIHPLSMDPSPTELSSMDLPLMDGTWSPPPMDASSMPPPSTHRRRPGSLASSSSPHDGGLIRGPLMDGIGKFTAAPLGCPPTRALASVLLPSAAGRFLEGVL